VSLRSYLGSVSSVWEVTTLGLGFWEAERRGAPSVIHSPSLASARAVAWSGHLNDAHHELRGDGGHELSGAQLDWLIATTSDGADLDALHACLFGLDYANADAFIDGWRAQHGDEVLLRPGELLPVPDMLWPALKGQPLISRPSSVNQPDDGELPHVRRYGPLLLGGRELEIVIDFEFEAELQEVLLPGFTAAAVHPYGSLGDFRNADGIANFPIAPRKTAPAVDAVRDALKTGATVIVVPELHVPSPALKHLRRQMAERDEPCLLIAGSRHEDAAGRKLNIATGLFAGIEELLVHTKLSRALSPLAPEGPSFELIDQPEPLRLRLWQAGSLRVAVLICKDVLDTRIALHLAHLGVNVLLGPAMSQRTDAFRGHAEWLLSDAQCVSLIVNGPLDWKGRQPDPSSLLTRPVAGQQRSEHSRTTPGIDLLRLAPERR
jgi:hypothetical protein